MWSRILRCTGTILGEEVFFQNPSQNEHSISQMSTAATYHCYLLCRFQNPLSTHTFSICLNHLSTGGMKSIKSNALEPDSPRCNQVPDAARCCQRLQDAGRSCQMLRDAAERSQMLPDAASPIAARCCQVLPEACSQNIHKHKYQYQCQYKCQSK